MSRCHYYVVDDDEDDDVQIVGINSLNPEAAPGPQLGEYRLDTPRCKLQRSLQYIAEDLILIFFSFFFFFFSLLPGHQLSQPALLHGLGRPRDAGNFGRWPWRGGSSDSFPGRLPVFLRAAFGCRVRLCWPILPPCRPDRPHRLLELCSCLPGCPCLRIFCRLRLRFWVIPFLGLFCLWTGYSLRI